MQDVAAAQLVRELLCAEVALEDAPRRPVVEHTLLVLGVDVRALARRVDEDQLARDAATLGDEALALFAFEVAIQEAREHAVEAAVGERQVERVSLDEARVRCLAPRLVEHLPRLVEPGDVAVQVAREEAGAARDVERRRGRERRDRAEQECHLFEPVAFAAMRELPPPEPHVVVLGRPRVVVLLHRS